MKYLISYFVLICIFMIGCSSIKNKTENSISNSSEPKLSKPIIKKIWIPPETRNGGREYVEGHYLYLIETESKWSR